MVCYIILHFQVEEETVNCVNQLKQVDGDHKIIIVDNCSPNGSGKKLSERYKNDSEIDVILHDKNDGFARGNNVGCKYAKEKYNPDFYVVMNNDIEITQRDFETVVEDIYKRVKFDVLGPDIYSTTYKIHQSPKSMKRTTIEGARKLKNSYKKKIDSKFIVPMRCYMKKIPFLKRGKDILSRGGANINYQDKCYDVPLHGSCVIFSKKFMDRRKHAFFSKTFFYYEMEILDYECQKHGFKVAYDPSIKVLHHQNVSTNATFGNEVKKVRFMNEQNYDSISAFLEAYE